MDYEIGKRLREFRERSNIKMPAIAASTGIAKETLYKWERGTRPSDINEYLKLKAYLDKMEDKVEEDVLGFEARKPATLRLPLNTNRLPVPQADGKAVAGTIVFSNNEPELIVYRVNAPFLGLAEGVIPVFDESMAPLFRNGCGVAIVRLKFMQQLHWGYHYYIIDKNWHGIVRRIYPGEEGNDIKLVSDNPDQYPPFQRSWDQITAVFRIVATILQF